MLPVAKLFYHLMEELIDKLKITASEVEKQKTNQQSYSLPQAGGALKNGYYRIYTV